ncbi:MAG: SDR family oxidoreductase [Leptospirales bacterium]|nr:SDR family oxidoreductase [Leptospirales bacterium]
MKPRVFLITGAGSGIGFELARQAAARGNIVYAGIRNLSKWKAPAESARPIQLDVNAQDQVDACINQIQKDAGPVDVLVNNAGFGVYGAFEELTEVQIREQYETNLFGCMRMVRAVLPQMRERRSGTVVNVSSILGRLTIPTGSAYTGSKFALEAFTETLRYEVKPFGVKVFAVEPGLIRTRFKDNMVRSNRVEDSASPYRFLNRMIQRDYPGFSTSPQRAASRILTFINRRNPSRRYRVGLDAIFYNRLIEWFPDSFIAALVQIGVNTSYKKS